MFGSQPSTKLSDISAEQLEDARAVLEKVGGPHVVWGAQSALDLLVAQARLESERLASRRLLMATWALVIATFGLVVATVALVRVG